MNDEVERKGGVMSEQDTQVGHKAVLKYPRGCTYTKNRENHLSFSSLLHGYDVDGRGRSVHCHMTPVKRSHPFTRLDGEGCTRSSTDESDAPTR